MPPVDDDAERCVLAMAREGHIVDIPEDEWGSGIHQLVYVIMREAWRRGIEPTTDIVVMALRDDGYTESIRTLVVEALDRDAVPIDAWRAPSEDSPRSADPTTDRDSDAHHRRAAVSDMGSARRVARAQCGDGGATWVTSARPSTACPGARCRPSRSTRSTARSAT